MPHRHRFRFTVRRGMAIVVAFALLALIFRTTFDAIEQAHTAARRSICVNNLKGLSLAMSNYESSMGSLPPGTVPGSGLPPERRLNWMYLLRAYMGWQPSRHGTDTNLAWDAPANWPPPANPVESACVSCPSSSSKPGHPNLSYVGIAGVGPDAPTLPPKHPRAGVFGYDRTTRFEEITDGMADTMMFAETLTDLGPWTAGGRSSIRAVDPATRPHIGPDRAFGSHHPGGMNVAACDGSVKFVRDTIDPKVFEAMSTIAGGEAVIPGW